MDRANPALRLVPAASPPMPAPALEGRAQDLVNAVREVDGVRNVENLLHTPSTKASAKK